MATNSFEIQEIYFYNWVIQAKLKMEPFLFETRAWFAGEGSKEGNSVNGQQSQEHFPAGPE